MEIPGGVPEKPTYKNEVQSGVKLFEKGFKNLQESKFDAQKLEYKKSMKESLQVIQDAAKGLMNQELLKQKEELANDFQQYLDNPTSENEQKVQHDIDSLKKSAG